MPTYTSATDSRGYYTSLIINEVSQNIESNTTEIYYEFRLHSGPYNYFQSFGSTINLTIDGVTLLNTTTQSVSFSSPFYNTSVLLASGNRTINHNADGTRSISFSSSFRTNTTTTYTPIPTHTISGSQALTTIPRASQPTLNISSQALGSAITINTNRASTSFGHILKYAFGSEQGTIATGVGDSTSWTLPNSLANAIPNGTSGSGTITCETYSGSTLIGTRTVAFTATVPNNATFQPSASFLNVAEAASGLSGFTVHIQNKSQLIVQSAASGKFGATISSIRVTVDGVNYWGSSITTNVITKEGTVTVSLLVTDSRGHSITIIENKTFVPYFNPRINWFSASRSPNDQGTDLSAPINFEIAPVSNQNTRYYRLRYRVVGGSWVLLFESNGYYSRTATHTGSGGILNGNNSYEIELYVADYFTAATRTVTIGTAFDLINFNASGRGLAIGKVSEGDIFEVEIPTKFKDRPTIGNQIFTSGIPSAYYLPNSFFLSNMIYSYTGYLASYQPQLLKYVIIANPNRGGFHDYRTTVTGDIFISRDWNGSEIVYKIQHVQGLRFSGGGGLSLNISVYWASTGSSETTIVNDQLIIRTEGFISNPESYWIGVLYPQF